MGYTVNGQESSSSVAAADITDAGAAGIPLAHGDALEVRGENEPLTTLRLRLTSTSGTTVSLEAAGW